MKNKQFLTGLIKKSAEGTYHVIASTAALDRQGESIQQAGWDINNFNNNPIILYSHDYSETTLPIGRAENVVITATGLEMDIVFATEDASPLAGQIKKLVDQGILNTLSVGFMVKNRNGNIITESELLEVSIVKVPANPQAVISMRSMTDIDDEVKQEIEAASTVTDDNEDTELAPEEEKGEVADELAADETVEQKYAYLDEIFEIMYAFCDVYMDEATPVEDMEKLLTETANLLLAYAKAPYTEDDEAETDAAKTVIAEKALMVLAKRFAISEKVGAEISDKNKKKLSTLKDNLTSGLSVVDDILSSGSQDDGGKAAPAGNIEPDEETKVAPHLSKGISMETLVTLQRQMRTNASLNTKGLEILNAFIKAKEDQAPVI